MNTLFSTSPTRNNVFTRPSRAIYCKHHSRALTVSQTLCITFRFFASGTFLKCRHCGEQSTHNYMTVLLVHHSIFYNNDMLWCTNNTVIRIFVSALFSASPTLQKCTTRKKVQDSQCSTVVFSINDSRRSCKLIIPCRLNR